jgi:phosphoribosylanthranilate isomerase
VIKVKICGLSEIEHVVAASEAGADFLGLLFAQSRRQVSIERAPRLAEEAHGLSPHSAVVGVFVNLESQEVNRIADRCRLDCVQLSGNESWQYCREINYPIIKTVHIPVDRTAEAVLADVEAGYRTRLQRGLVCHLDAQVDNAYGGTGETFDWQLAGEVSARFPVIVAGGLTPANVGQLVKRVRPWGVDVSSGVETNDQKDITKIKAFIESVRQAEKEVEGGQ